MHSFVGKLLCFFSKIFPSAKLRTDKKPTSVEKYEKDGIEKELRGLWNRYAPFYRGTLLTPSVQQMGKMLLDAIVPCPGGVVHDAGCGIGYWLIPILEKTSAKKLVGTDYSEQMLRLAQKTLAKSGRSKRNQVELRKMDLSTQWPKEKFDAQVFHLFLYYLPYRRWKEILKKAFDSTKSGGYIYSSTLLKGFSIKKASKKYLLREFFLMPLKALPFLVKATNIIKRMDEFVEADVVEYPRREEFVEYHQQLGFTNVEVVGNLLGGGGIIVRAQKP